MMVLFFCCSTAASAQQTEQSSADTTNDSNVVVEETTDTSATEQSETTSDISTDEAKERSSTEQASDTATDISTGNTHALTPEGNATLIDDFVGGNKQLITIMSREGHYFYIIIDRDDDGENTVHFLNQVDAADLKALIGGSSNTEEESAVCICSVRCQAGDVNLNCPVCTQDYTHCAANADATPPEETNGNSLGVFLILFVLIGVGGAALFYFKVVKPKQDAVNGDDDLFNYELYDDELAAPEEDDQMEHTVTAVETDDDIEDEENANDTDYHREA